MTKETDIFELWFDDSDDEAVICHKYDLRGFNEYLMSDGISLMKIWPSNVTFYAEGKHVEDYLGNAKGWLLFSKRLKDKLTEISVTKDVEFLPVPVLWADTKKEIPGYSVVNVTKVISAFDPENSVWEPDPDNPNRPMVIKHVLKRQAIGDADIFRIKEDLIPVFVSKRFKEAVESMDATGFKFSPIRTS